MNKDVEIGLYPCANESHILSDGKSVIAYRRSYAYAFQDYVDRNTDMRDRTIPRICIQGCNYQEFRDKGFDHYELYVFDDEKIKKGDTVLTGELELQVVKLVHDNGFYLTYYYENGTDEMENTEPRKVLATTKKSNLPVISEEFMEIFSKEKGHITIINIQMNEDGTPATDKLGHHIIINNYQTMKRIPVT